MAIVKLQGETEKASGIYYEIDTSIPTIGEGGMGRVYAGQCVDTSTKISKPVAIKFLFNGLPQHAIERARREASIHLKNDNIIEMLGFIETETLIDDKPTKRYHVVSELLNGVSLSDVMDGKLCNIHGEEITYARKLYNDYKADSTRFAKYVVSNVLSGLVTLHDAGYIHRDIDPSNIMVTDDEHIKLIDFGIAKQVNKLTTHDCSRTTDGVFIGKAEYASPELALGDTKHQDQTTDIYAMGILLYQCVVGHAPFEGPVNKILQRQIKEKIDLSVIKDKGLRHIISIATAKNQDERYQTASQMRVAFEQQEGLKPQMAKTAKMKIIAAACVAIFAIFSIFGYMLFLKHEANVTQQKIEAALFAKNDSLKQEASRLVIYGDRKLETGLLHGEEYDVSLLDAYKSYNKAALLIKDITSYDKEKNDVNNKLKQTTEALRKSKEEFDEKATMFSNEGMTDVAESFKKRSAIIEKTLK